MLILMTWPQWLLCGWCPSRLDLGWDWTGDNRSVIRKASFSETLTISIQTAWVHTFQIALLFASTRVIWQDCLITSPIPLHRTGRISDWTLSNSVITFRLVNRARGQQQPESLKWWHYWSLRGDRKKSNSLIKFTDKIHWHIRIWLSGVKIV